jgi:hypothetical protein
VREQVGYIFTGMAIVALGAYARVNLGDVAHIRQIGDLATICGFGLVCYAIAMIAVERNAYR